MDRPDYVLLGHVTRDLLPGDARAGGTVLYAGVAAARLGRRVAVATVCADDVAIPSELASAIIARRRSARTTTFAITTPLSLTLPRQGGGDAGRSLRLLQRAPPLTRQDVPPAWRASSHTASNAVVPIVHLAPVADELPRSAPRWFAGNRVVATLQGWLRSFSTEGLVSPVPDALDRIKFDGLYALVFSTEDVGGDDRVVERVAARVPVVAVTRGVQGCTVHADGRVAEVPACPAREVDATGAGDVFGAAFFVRLGETDDPVASAYFASCAAALSVEGPGLSCIPDRKQVKARLVEWAPWAA